MLIDIRHKPQPIDLHFMEWLGQNQVPFTIVFTKADKLKPQQRQKQVQHYKETLLAEAWETTPPLFITSATNKTGCDILLNYIGDLNEEFKKLKLI